jgi:hypothetical protein
MHDGNLENILWRKFVINGGLLPNLKLCWEIGAHVNNSNINCNKLFFCNNVGVTLQIWKIASFKY